MVVFPNAKINLGLNVVEKRSDGFHNIETIFYPVGWSDVLEVLESNSDIDFTLQCSGLKIDSSLENNLIYKAYQLIKAEHALPHISVFLHKVIPMGAGLGGGSSDAAFFINLLNTKFDLNIPEDKRIHYAKQLGSDCAFFIKNTPIYATRKGDVFDATNVDLKGYHIVIIYPNIHSNTKEAYTNLVPQKPIQSLNTRIQNLSIDNWKDTIINDFETSLFLKYPKLSEIKQELYNAGAIYSSMSGSGSAVYGIFKEESSLSHYILPEYSIWKGRLN